VDRGRNVRETSGDDLDDRVAMRGDELRPFLAEWVFRHYVDPKKAYEVRTVDAAELSLAPRLDMGAKLPLAACFAHDRIDLFCIRRYLEHLYRLNRFSEIDPRKETPADFLTHFRETVSSIGSAGFRRSVSLVPVDSHMTPIDGSHRVAACITLNEPVTIVVLTEDARRFGANTFRDRRQSPTALLEEDWATSSIFLGFADAIRTARIATIFPVGLAAGVEPRTLEGLPGCRGVLGGFTADLGFDAATALVEEIYAGEEWARDRDGLERKVGFAGWSNGGVASTQILVLDVHDDARLTAAKRALREAGGYRDGLHISDGHGETRRLAWTLFPRAGWWLLHRRGTRHRVDRAWATLRTLGDAVDASIWLDEAFVDGSYVMELAGLRDANDIDMAALGGSRASIRDALACFERPWSFRSGSERRDEVVDAMTKDPERTCVVRGVRICTPDALVAFKKQRMELPKDVADLALLQRAFSECGLTVRQWR
jgi:hypothetical protein